MASILDNTYLPNIRDIPLSALDGPPPTRVTSTSYRTIRDGWPRKQNNIWQSSARLFDLMSPDKEHEGFSIRTNSMTTTNVSSTPTEPSAKEHHNMASNNVNAAHIPSLSTTLSNMSIEPLISPTRSRTNGVLGSDTTSIPTNRGQSSLLPGSAPDSRPPNLSTSSHSFGYPHNSTIGKGFRPFSVDDAEDFTPLCSKNRAHLTDRMSRRDNSETTRFHANLPDTGPDDEFTGGYGLPIAQQRELLNSSYARLQSSSRGTSFNNLNPTINGDAYFLTPNHERDGSGLLTTATAANNRWAVAHNTNHVSQVNGLSSSFKPSSLRPDVASYRPSNQRNHIVPQVPTPNNLGNSYDASNLYRFGNTTTYLGTANQNHSVAYPNGFSHGSSLGYTPSTGYHDGTWSGRTTAPVATESKGDGLRNGATDREAAYHRSDMIASNGSRSTASNQGNSFLHSVSSNHVPYNSSNNNNNNNNIGQHEFSSEIYRTTQYQQQYNGEPAATLGGYAQNDIYLPESESNDIARSEVLEEFRTYHKSKKYELKDIYGHIVEFSGDQTGSRFIQTKLEQANSDEKDQIFLELQTNARQLMSDVFGNYVIQKMFEYGNQSQKKSLASHMQGYILKLSLQPYGCRCVQKAFEHILTDQQALLIKELDGHVISIVESQHGNHVIQKAIECIPGEHVQFIVDAHKNQVVRLAKHPYGCRIIQRMLEFCQPQARHMILDELHSAIPQLIDDQFGNYVIQCMIKRCSPNDRSRVIGFVQQNLLYYSTHKFASNVVEKAIQFAEDNQKFSMIRQLTCPNPNNGIQSPVLTLLKDQYGNYVMQTVLRAAQGSAKKMLADEVRHHLNCIGKVNRGRQVAAMAETLNTITAEHSPSSVSTGPQTPCTPTSLHSGGEPSISTAKTIEIVQPGYLARDLQRQYEYS